MLNNINILVLCTWIVFSLFLLLRIVIDNENSNLKKIQFIKIKDIAETGDLICFRWNYVDALFRIFSNFSHVGMIIKINKKLYILEIHPNEDDKINGGVHLYLLENRIKGYYGNYYYTKLNTTYKKRKNIKNHIKSNLQFYKQSIHFDDNFKYIFVQNYIYNLFNLKINKRNTMFCSEFIGNILKKTNIYVYHNLISLHPSSFLNFKINQKYLYQDLQEILFQ